MKKQNKGITLIALVITIIILLILAGVSIAALTGSGLFEKARNAEEEFKEGQELENTTLEGYENRIESILGSRADSGDLKLNSCIIEVSETGVVTVKNVPNMISFSIIQDGKCVDTTKDSTYSIRATTGQTVSVYVIAIDEDANLYKSNTVSYTCTALYLYSEGNNYEAVTGGWNLLTDTNATIDIDSYDYMLLNSKDASFCMSSICTKNTIDITNYEKLKMEVTVDFHDTSGTGGYRIGIRETNTMTTDWDTCVNVTDKFRQSGENMIIELDISSNSGSYYIEVENVRAITKINRMWLE